jgi:hypothetical protein
MASDRGVERDHGGWIVVGWVLVEALVPVRLRRCYWSALDRSMVGDSDAGSVVTGLGGPIFPRDM